MIVVTLLAHSIPHGPMVVTECKDASGKALRLEDGCKLHCHPDLATQLQARYKDHFKNEGHADRPGVAAGARFDYEPGTKAKAKGAAPSAPAKALEDTGAALAAQALGGQDKSMAGKGKAKNKESAPAPAAT